jgi:hypothetical protein
MHLKELENENYIAIDKDGTKWKCKRKPFNNGLGNWFVELKDFTESYEMFMEKI